MKFSYEGVTSSGEKVNGKFSGTKQELIAEAKQRGISLLKLSESKKKLSSRKFNGNDFQASVENLYYLLSSGMRVDKSLKLIISTARKQSVVDFHSLILDDIKGGKPLSESLKAASKSVNFQLSGFYISMISTGEEIGNLPAVLSRLKDHLEFKKNMTSEVKSALFYPTFLIIMSFIAILLIFLVIVPRFSGIFTAREMGKLPLISKLVIGMGNFFNNNFLSVTFILFMSVIALLIVFPYIKPKLKSLIVHFPGLKKLAFGMELSNVLSSLGTMINSGIEVDRAFKQILKLIGTSELKTVLEDTIKGIKNGEKISDIWQRSGIIPQDVISLTTVGENSARLGESFIALGNRYLLSFKRDVKLFLSILEPLIVVMLGIFIGFIVISIMLAVLSISDIAS